MHALPCVAVTKTASLELGKKDSIACILLHPGTVDTGHSCLFQRNVARSKSSSWGCSLYISSCPSSTMPRPPSTMPRRLTTGNSSLGMVKKSHGDHWFQSVTVPPPPTLPFLQFFPCLVFTVLLIRNSFVLFSLKFKSLEWNSSKISDMKGIGSNSPLYRILYIYDIGQWVQVSSLFPRTCIYMMFATE